jgi:hypothetical protein
VTRQKSQDFAREIGLKDEYDLIYVGALFEATERVNEQRHAAKLKHLLGATRVHPRAYSGCGYDGDVRFRLGHCEAELWREAF